MLQADGRTNPRWRGCQHVNGFPDNRCPDCGVLNYGSRKVSRHVGGLGGYRLADLSVPRTIGYCKHGHELTDASSWVTNGGARVCRECKRLAHAKWYRERGADLQRQKRNAARSQRLAA